MVSFVCESCQETLKKQKLDQHKQRCYYAQYTCVDCSVTFQGTDYRAHTSCISEAEKYQKSVYKPTKKELAQKQKQEKQQTSEATTQQSPFAATNSSNNTAVAPKSVPLIAQLESKKRSEPESKLEQVVDASVKKSKKTDGLKGEAMSTSASNASVEFDFKKIIKSVLKKNQDALSVAELRNKVVEKIVKKSEQTIDAKIVAKLFDKSVFASLNTADFIQLN